MKLTLLLVLATILSICSANEVHYHFHNMKRSMVEGFKHRASKQFCTYYPKKSSWINPWGHAQGWNCGKSFDDCQQVCEGQFCTWTCRKRVQKVPIRR